jgi:hypothetical protein
MPFGKLQKIGNVESPHIDPRYQSIRVNQFEEGEFLAYPTVGGIFQIFGPDSRYQGDNGRYLRTSSVVSVCQMGTSRDKLVLPKDLKNVDLDSLPADMGPGDFLFCTLNSVYTLVVDKTPTSAKMEG